MSIWNRCARWIVAVACAAIVCVSVAEAADEAPADKAPADKAPSPVEIAARIEQLDADSFAERQAASDALNRIGKPAVEALAEAAVGDSLEVVVRAIDILKDLMESGDTATQEAAKAAMEQVAKSDRAAAARRAADALKAAEAKQAPAVQRFGGGIQLNVLGGARRINVRTVNGVKTIEAEEADRKIKIVDDPKDGIKMEVTAKKDGKEVTNTYEAKNAEEFKKQHPDAYEIYAKYNQMGGRGAIAVQLQMGNVQALAPVQRPNNIDNLTRVLQSWAVAVERMATDEAIKDAPQESREALKKKVAEVNEQLDKLDKRLQEAIEKAAEELVKERPDGEEQ